MLLKLYGSKFKGAPFTATFMYLKQLVADSLMANPLVSHDTDVRHLRDPGFQIRTMRCAHRLCGLTQNALPSHKRFCAVVRTNGQSIRGLVDSCRGRDLPTVAKMPRPRDYHSWMRSAMPFRTGLFRLFQVPDRTPAAHCGCTAAEAPHATGSLRCMEPLPESSSGMLAWPEPGRHPE